MRSDPSSPLCYRCKFRGTVPGSAHSTCRRANSEDVLYLVLGSSSLNIKGNPHGIKSGWFLWPLDFDPVWLENCDGFEEREKDHA